MISKVPVGQKLQKNNFSVLVRRVTIYGSKLANKMQMICYKIGILRTVNVNNQTYSHKKKMLAKSVSDINFLFPCVKCSLD